jgi:hypothetical protein
VAAKYTLKVRMMPNVSYFLHSVRAVIDRANQMNDKKAASEYLRDEYNKRSKPWRVTFDKIYKENHD